MNEANVPAGSSRRSPTSLASALAAAWLTTNLSPELRIELAVVGRLETLPANVGLTTEGETTEDFGIVLAGRVALRTRVPERGMVTILTVEPGDVVGWSALVPPHRATSTAVTMVPTELALFDGQALRTALDGNAELAAHVYPAVLQAVARRLEGTRLQLLDLFTQRWVEPW